MATPEFGAEERTPRKVLLIDEDPKTARLVRTLLSGTGYSLLPSTRHAEGLRLATRHQSVLILTEVYFEKTDGPALAEKLLARHGGKLAFLTADESLLARFRRILMGAVDFLSKGDDVAQLRQRLRGILSSTLPLPVPISFKSPEAEALLAKLEELESQQATGVLEFSGEGGAGRIALDGGRAKFAHSRDLRGDAAINDLARRADWELTFLQGATLADLPPLPVEEAAPAGADGGSATLDPPRTLELSPDEITPVDPEEVPTAPGDLEKGFTDLGAYHRGVDATSPTMQDWAAVKIPPPSGQAPVAQEEPTQEEDIRGLVGNAAGDLEELGDATGEFEIPGPEDLEKKSATPVKPEEEQEARFSGHHSETSIRSRVPAPRPLLREWLTNFYTAPLLLVFPQEEVRRALERRTEALGFKVGSTTTGVEALELTRSLGPVAIVGDLNLPDMDGRELLARVRSDFTVRETPFLVISGEDLAQQLYEMEGEALDPVIMGLESALGPRVKLYGRIKSKDTTSVPGAVEPVGVTTLLRTLGACRRSGHLLLKTGLKRNAELVLRRGAITAVTIHRPISEAGMRALVQLVGLE